jgi:hypothetical protein
MSKGKWRKMSQMKDDMEVARMGARVALDPAGKRAVELEIQKQYKLLQKEREEVEKDEPKTVEEALDSMEQAVTRIEGKVAALRLMDEAAEEQVMTSAAKDLESLEESLQGMPETNIKENTMENINNNEENTMNTDTTNNEETTTMNTTDTNDETTEQGRFARMMSNLKARVDALALARNEAEKEKHQEALGLALHAARTALPDKEIPRAQSALKEYMKVVLLPRDYKEACAVVATGAVTGSLAYLLDVGTGGVVTATLGGMVCAKGLWTAIKRQDDLRHADKLRRVNKIIKGMNKADNRQ